MALRTHYSLPITVTSSYHMLHFENRRKKKTRNSDLVHGRKISTLGSSGSTIAVHLIGWLSASRSISSSCTAGTISTSRRTALWCRCCSWQVISIVEKRICYVFVLFIILSICIFVPPSAPNYYGIVVTWWIHARMHRRFVSVWQTTPCSVFSFKYYPFISPLQTMTRTYITIAIATDRAPKGY